MESFARALRPLLQAAHRGEKEELVVVDFGSGSGNVSLPLAWHFRAYKVHTFCPRPPTRAPLSQITVTPLHQPTPPCTEQVKLVLVDMKPRPLQLAQERAKQGGVHIQTVNTHCSLHSCMHTSAQICTRMRTH